MSGKRELTPTDYLSLELLQAARQRRELDITTAAETARLADDVLEEQATVKLILGREAVALAMRMSWLYKHPRRHRLLGGSAIKVTAHDKTARPPIIGTPLLLATAAEFVDNAAIVDGYTFRTQAGKHERGARISIEHHVVDTMTGISKEYRKTIVTFT